MKNISNREKLLLGIIILVLFISMILFKGKEETLLIEEDVFDDNSSNYEENLKNEGLNCDENDIMMVHISGAVKNPGIIEIKTGDRLIDAIELSGGLTDEADDNQINLAKRLSDEEKIYIPIIGEIVENVESSVDEEGNSKVDINNCTKLELITLPGIGDKTAEKIIEYREGSPFENIEDLMLVSGIGEKKFKSIESLIIVK